MRIIRHRRSGLLPGQSPVQQHYRSPLGQPVRRSGGARLRSPVWAMLLAAFVAPAYGARVFVDSSAQGSESGLSWQDAFTDLQPALASAASGDEIWVACDTYLPSRLLDLADPRSATFAVTTGVSVLGGFSGGETQLDQRDPNPQTNGCVLGERPPTNGSFAGNYHIMRIQSGTAPVLIDGFGITGGRATGDTVETQTGGGMRILSSSSVTLRNLRFDDVTTRTDGPGFGGAVFADASNLVMEDIVINRGASGRGGGVAVVNGSHTAHGLTITDSRTGFGGGGAVFTRGGAMLEVSDSLFANNFGNNQGGAILHEGAGPLTIRRSVFEGNQTARNGGAKGGALFHQLGVALVIENSVFVGNAVSGGSGGAIAIGGSGAATITNTTIAHNQADTIASGVLLEEAVTLVVQNSVLHGNLLRATSGSSTHQVGIVETATALASVDYSIIKGGFAGTGNRDVAPGFVQTPTPGDGSWVTRDDNDLGNVRLRPNSPAIDAGNNLALIDVTLEDGITAADVLFDADLRARVVDAADVPDTGTGGAPVIDIGAYEYSDLLFMSGFESD